MEGEAMGFLDFLFGSRLPEVRDPEHLRGLLFDAAAAGDARRVEKLARAHRDAVLEHFPNWQKVPEAVRTDPAAAQRYFEGLIAVAQVFAQRLGTPDLLQHLIGTEESNPLLRWQNRLRQAQELIAGLRYREARDLLADLLIDVHDMKGTGADAYLPITLGRLGECYFQGGEADKAVAPLGQALQLCEQHGDADGVVAYLGNLYEVHRYLGQPGPAADYAGRLADVLDQRGRRDDAARYRKQAAIVRAGEPLNRVVAIRDGRRYELDEAPAIAEGKVQVAFERNRGTLRPAEVLTERGKELAGTGSFDDALAAFRDAASADRFDPDCHYQAGLTLLHLQRPVEAVESYEATEERAPGWYHCRADLWLAQQMTLGKVDHATFLAVHVLEDGPQSPAEKVRIAEQAVARAPDLAVLHLARGKNLARLGRSADAQAAYREGLARSPEPDVKTRLLVELGSVLDNPGKQTAMLEEARALNGNLVAAAMATLALQSFAARR
jgi:tetratricopeptide (TPR) repeat protein